MFGKLVDSFRAKAATQAQAGDRDVGTGKDSDVSTCAFTRRQHLLATVDPFAKQQIGDHAPGLLAGSASGYRIAAK